MSPNRWQDPGSYCEGAHDFNVNKLKIDVTNVSSSAFDPLKELESRIAAGAIHDSAERWIVHGNEESEEPKKIKWITGPAGTGKTAIMGSLADRCKVHGLLPASFFFASWSASIGRRRKTAFIATIAHQLAEHQQHLKDAIANAVAENPIVFEKNLDVQIETLILAPLRKVSRLSNAPGLRGVIMIDGMDECEAEQYHDSEPGSGLRPKLTQARTKEKDQLEILEALHKAALDPAFPFLILIASRPERVFREFFDPERGSTPFAPKLDLNEDYDAGADIALYLEAQFSRIRRRYRLSPSWPPPRTIQTLVENASGQFIYVCTVIRFLDESPKSPPDALLNTILAMQITSNSNPFQFLDALYSHILESSLNPLLSIRWINAINHFNSNEDHTPRWLSTRTTQSDSDELVEMANAHSTNPKNSPNAEWSPNWHTPEPYNHGSREASDLDIQRETDVLDPDASNVYPDRSDSISMEVLSPTSFHLNFLLQKNDGEAEHLLGNLHSLVHIPSPGNVGRDALYGFYHRSLFDFLKDPERCGSLHVTQDEHSEFIWDRVLQVYEKSVNSSFGAYLGFYSIRFTTPIVDWWVSEIIARSKQSHLILAPQLWRIFCAVHTEVRYT
ncbi:hypothetical protein EST38_g13810 [Candolleomyces aberdarensis]|uniref:Nephrocystin 3-like N-terminal domain-containing protein n=1 Tax=Candolleomyces aberdarensis TaxID=2316362 RepID=A0A4Q2D1A8_9AGAR|nr:hypothetical protein EST38_g13810 [Candolleomyces aberdarensis]